MIVTNFKSGATSGAVNYVLSNKNHKNEPRASQPEILKGDKHNTLNAGDMSSRFSNKTTSGVISFAPNENPTKAQMLEVIDNYEQTFLSNMVNRVAPLYVLHNDENHQHIHVIIPNVDLETGKYYNPFPPGPKTANLIKDFSSIENHRLGYEQVNKNPYKSQKTKPQQKAHTHKDIDFFNQLSHSNTSKRQFEKSCIDLVKNGTVKNRDELIAFLKDNNYAISRQGDNYISIEREGKNWRFSGGIFDSKADYKALNNQKIKEIETLQNNYHIAKEQKEFNPEQTKIRIGNAIAVRDAFNTSHFDHISTTPIIQPETATPGLHQPSHSQEEMTTLNNNYHVAGGDFSPSTATAIDLTSAEHSVAQAQTALANAKTPEQQEKAMLALQRAFNQLINLQNEQRMQDKNRPK